MTLLDRAIKYATDAHGNQKRKYTNDPYIEHPLAVMEIVRSVSHTEEMLAAAVLHDVVEDTDVTIEDVMKEFGDTVAHLVADLTDVSKPEDGNRALRKSLDRDHTAKASAQAQTIKLADLIHNGQDIELHDPSFYRVYKEEKIKLLEVLTKGDINLRKRAQQMIGGG